MRFLKNRAEYGEKKQKMNKIQLGVSIATSAIGIGIFAYIQFLKKKMKRFVLRNEKIKKFFRED